MNGLSPFLNIWEEGNLFGINLKFYVCFLKVDDDRRSEWHKSVPLWHVVTWGKKSPHLLATKKNMKNKIFTILFFLLSYLKEILFGAEFVIVKKCASFVLQKHN